MLSFQVCLVSQSRCVAEKIRRGAERLEFARTLTPRQSSNSLCTIQNGHVECFLVTINLKCFRASDQTSFKIPVFQTFHLCCTGPDSPTSWPLSLASLRNLILLRTQFLNIPVHRRFPSAPKTSTSNTQPHSHTSDQLWGVHGQ